MGRGLWAGGGGAVGEGGGLAVGRQSGWAGVGKAVGGSWQAGRGVVCKGAAGRGDTDWVQGLTTLATLAVAVLHSAVYPVVRQPLLTPTCSLPGNPPTWRCCCCPPWPHSTRTTGGRASCIVPYDRWAGTCRSIPYRTADTVHLTVHNTNHGPFRRSLGRLHARRPLQQHAVLCVLTTFSELILLGTSTSLSFTQIMQFCASSQHVVSNGAF